MLKLTLKSTATAPESNPPLAHFCFGLRVRLPACLFACLRLLLVFSYVEPRSGKGTRQLDRHLVLGRPSVRVLGGRPSVHG